MDYYMVRYDVGDHFREIFLFSLISRLRATTSCDDLCDPNSLDESMSLGPGIQKKKPYRSPNALPVITLWSEITFPGKNFPP